MAGASFRVRNKDVLARLEQLEQQGADMSKPLRSIGEMLMVSTQRRFSEQRSPDGVPWAALSPDYRKSKRKNADKILTLEGYLRGLMRYTVTDNTLRFGTDRVYAAPHQFGRNGIAARPFLGISKEDAKDSREIIKRHVGLKK